MAELHRDAEVGEVLGALHQVLLVLARDHEPLGELEQDGPELAGGVKRHQRVVESLPHLVHQLRRQLLAVQVPLLGDLLGKLVPDVLVQAARPGGVVGQERVRLDVEREVLRRPLDPKDRVALGWRRVIRAVHLHDRKLLRVEAQAVLGAHALLRIEGPGLDQRGLSPPGDPDQDLAHAPRAPLWPAGRSVRGRPRSDRGSARPSRPARTPARSRVGLRATSAPNRPAASRSRRGRRSSP